MNAGLVADIEAQSNASSVLRTLALCDLVDSTGLVERMGDLAAAELIRKHDRLARSLADRHHGREIDKTDGFMMMFDRPVQAVAYALDYQRGLRQLNAAEQASLSARVGIHVGDIVIWDNSAEDIAKGAKPIEVEGLVKPVTSRLMNLALPGQILLSNIAYSLAYRAQGELGPQLATIRWRTHGRYRFRGVPEPVPVFEVGEEGLAPLKAPPWSSKAHREVPFWRRPATVFVEALVVAALIAAPLVMFLRPDPAIAFAKRDWVVVGSLHNLTGETVFDDALESALRIGLEQSRHVNVLPDLKVRDTITRMQRDPDKTEVDREVGSEVAIRDGARALILPTIAEIGGRVRITAEVIDPNTQTTVYSETADGIGKESILSSLDTINERLRVRLGEALATVSSESKPLEKVATKSLDALRSYTMGLHAYDSSRHDEAEKYYQQSLAVDPEFALAWVGLAKVHLVRGKRTAADKALRKAASMAGRVSPRDAMYIDAMLASSNGSSQREAMKKWKILTGTYPDFLTGQSLRAYYLWDLGNRIVDAIEPAVISISPQNANQKNSQLLLGTLYLANERSGNALAQFENAHLSESPELAWIVAMAKAADREYVEIETMPASTRSASAFANSTDVTIARAAILIDQGHAAEGLALLNVEGLNLDLHRLGASTLLEERSLNDRWSEFLNAAKRTLDKAEPAERVEVQTRLLFGAYLAARAGSISAASKALKGMGPEPRSGEFPILSNLLAVAESELALAKGKPATSIEQLKPFVDGAEIFVTHVVLMDGFAAAGKIDEALREARWLMAHRGRAYAELNVPGTLPFNVAMTNLATLSAAEFALKSGDRKQARDLLEQFRRNWQGPIPTKALSTRVSSLEKELKLKGLDAE